jgi:magnesium transporter
MNLKSDKYLKYLHLPSLFTSKRTREILSVNPTDNQERIDVEQSYISYFKFNADIVEEKQKVEIKDVLNLSNDKTITWINIDGIKKAEVEEVCTSYNIHALIAEDILSVGQRPKTDDVEGVLYCLLNMLYYNEAQKTVETEQISVVLGKNFVISFQDDTIRDVFNPLRHKLRNAKSQVRIRTADYLLYSILDLVVDNYFLVMESLGDEIENLEADVVRKSNKRSLARINQLRKELIVLKRNIVPVRDLIGNIMRSESELLEDRTTKYFKDIYDHIFQAYDLTENYRDVIMSVQDLYLSNVNLKMNETMKIMAVLTTLLAPATVIGGIFGMNFDVIPFSHHQEGFYIAISLMLVTPILMLGWFRRKGML